MKKFICCFIALGILAYACNSSKKTRYTFPEGMKPNVRIQYAELCNKGKVLYEINCDGCHTIRERGKKIIPMFTAKQLEAYQIRISNPDHEERISEMNVNPEELSLIITFLQYVKRDKKIYVGKEKPEAEHNH